MDAASYNQYTDHNQTNPLHLRIHGGAVGFFLSTWQASHCCLSGMWPKPPKEVLTYPPETSPIGFV